METRRTQLLSLLVVGAFALAMLGYARLVKQHEAATSAARDLALCRSCLEELSAAKSSPGGVSPVSADDAELHQRLRAAAVAAGISESQPSSVEPGQAARIPQTEYQEFSVFIRLDSVTMKQLTVFLHELARRDPGSQAKSIELTSPPGADAGNQWTADVTVTYLVYAPRPDGKDDARGAP